MEQNNLAFYQAYLAKDSRFDGIFFIGITSTGIYCRPICTSKAPKITNCLFFKSAAEAEKNFFRPCLRCRPELAPFSSAIVDDSKRIAFRVISSIEENNNDSVENLANEFELSSRQLGRIIQKEFGVSPHQLILTKRLLLAKQLLTDTAISITNIAYASGFSSIRRFNDAFLKHYNFPPSNLRRNINKKQLYEDQNKGFKLNLSYQPPYDWNEVLKFLSIRLIKGLELIEQNNYIRSVSINHYVGTIKITQNSQSNILGVTISYSLLPVIAQLLTRIKLMFDLNIKPELINTHLSDIGIINNFLNINPGLRLIGSIDSFEQCIRAILGQQITVKAACTLMERFINKFGTHFKCLIPSLNKLCPTPEIVSNLQIQDLTELGIIRSRAKTIIKIAEKIVSGDLEMKIGNSPQILINKLQKIEGIGNWTANYIAMRTIGATDCFLIDDIVVKKAFKELNKNELQILKNRLSPWGSYAMMHLWRNNYANTIIL